MGNEQSSTSARLRPRSPPRTPLRLPIDVNCPRCRSLCLENSVLSCGHVICQNCQYCAVPDCTNQSRYGMDLILDRFVNERLQDDRAHEICQVCKERDVTKVCLTCGKLFCDGGAVCHSSDIPSHSQFRDLSSFDSNKRFYSEEHMKQREMMERVDDEMASIKKELQRFCRSGHMRDLEEKLKLLKVYRENLNTVEMTASMLRRLSGIREDCMLPFRKFITDLYRRIRMLAETNPICDPNETSDQDSDAEEEPDVSYLKSQCTSDNASLLTVTCARDINLEISTDGSDTIIILQFAWGRSKALMKELEAERERSRKKINKLKEKLRKKDEKSVRRIKRYIERLADITSEDFQDLRSRNEDLVKERDDLLDKLAEEHKMRIERELQLKAEEKKAKEREDEINLRYQTGEKPRKFLLKLENQDEKKALQALFTSRNSFAFRRAAEQLSTRFGVRLVAIDSDLRFIFEGSDDQWVTIVEKQNEIQKELEKLLPSEVRPHATWSALTQYDDKDAEIQLGQRFDVKEACVSPQYRIDARPLGESQVFEGERRVSVKHVAESDIRTADGDIVIATVDWPEDLKCLRELEDLKQNIRQEGVTGRVADAKITVLYRRHQKLKEAEQEMLKTFVIRPDVTPRLLRDMQRRLLDEQFLHKIVKRLSCYFDARLQSVDSALRFMLDTPRVNWPQLSGKEVDVEEELGEMLLLGVWREQREEEITWDRLSTCTPDVSVSSHRIGQPLRVYTDSTQN